MRQEHYDSIKGMLDRWAECMSVGGAVGEGARRECLGAPDARIHSIEDIEVEVDKLIVRAVDFPLYGKFAGFCSAPPCFRTMG
ncbi:hypothetical protein JAB1_46510 [Janthinobacterium sp. MP5059B]|uniref:hypothetical protein n=1 Tax=Janthinobacterium sp. MP5059B TaxID=1766683 RepID=UPI00087383D8|nr:hypothetical protein [Janthinobacterium sp. MP5059B]OEZ46713.1 hypothetical protein JAB1_46510 [Janthinobacterium sp. MP5059B]